MKSARRECPKPGKMSLCLRVPQFCPHVRLFTQDRCGARLPLSGAYFALVFRYLPRNSCRLRESTLHGSSFGKWLVVSRWSLGGLLILVVTVVLVCLGHGGRRGCPNGRGLHDRPGRRGALSLFRDLCWHSLK